MLLSPSRMRCVVWRLPSRNEWVHHVVKFEKIIFLTQFSLIYLNILKEATLGKISLAAAALALATRRSSLKTGEGTETTAMEETIADSRFVLVLERRDELPTCQVVVVVSKREIEQLRRKLELRLQLKESE